MKVLQNYIGGEWRPSRSGGKKLVLNPANRAEVVCESPLSTVADAEDAIVAAERAFPAWSRFPAPQRAELLEAALRGLESREDEFALAITRENGKTLRESRTELRAAIKEAHFQIGQGRRFGGKVVPSEQPGVVCYLGRFPLGVVSLITPWNFPLNVACRKMFPALVTGNCCVLKPSDLTPGVSALLVEVMADVGFPPGVINLVMGQGSVIGDTLVSHPAVKAVSFTGSTEVGTGIAARCAAKATRLQLEMGGKNPLVVLQDADLEKAIEAAMAGGFGCSGQWCTSTSRVIVEAAVYDPFVEGLAARAGKMVVGDGREPTTDMGPVSGERQYQTILSYIELGRKEGARLCVGGYPLCEGKLGQGCFIAPTVFADVTPNMRVAREEIFGPVLCVMRAGDFEEAMRLANDTIYGLASSVFTADLAKAQRFVQESEVGLCHVNMTTAWKEPQLEFGGIKESGRGLPEAGESGADFFTHHKAIYIRQKV
jgi:aldehyde dehydrogenase (NAD+)